MRLNEFIPSLSEWKLGVRYAIVVAVIAVVLLNLGTILTGLLPFLIAYALSIAIDPVVAFLGDRLRIGRGWSSLFVIVTLLVLGWLFGSWAYATVATAVLRFIEAYPQYQETVVAFVQHWFNRLTSAYSNLPPDILHLIEENTSELGSAIEQLLSTAGMSLFGIVRAVPGLVTAGLLIPLATFFISKDLPAIKKLLWSLLPESGRARVQRVMGDLWKAAWGYLRAQALLILMTMIVTTIGLLIVGVENWFTAGLLIGFLDFLPVLGPIVVFLPWIVYHLIVGNTTLAISLLAVYGVAAGLRALMEAKVVGDSIGIHPLAILLAMYLGALLLGVAGAIVGPVSFFLAKAIYRAWRNVGTNV